MRSQSSLHLTSKYSPDPSLFRYLPGSNALPCSIPFTRTKVLLRKVYILMGDLSIGLGLMMGRDRGHVRKLLWRPAAPCSGLGGLAAAAYCYRSCPVNRRSVVAGEKDVPDRMGQRGEPER